MSSATHARRLGPLAAVVTGGTDGRGAGDGPVVVLLHGFGAPGDDLVALAGALALPAAVRWVFPAAPLELDGGFGDARAWWLIDLVRLQLDLARGVVTDRSSEIPDGLDAARVAIGGVLDAVRDELGVADERVVLGGFSQGAMLACDVVLRSERVFAGLALLSGTLIARAQWQPRLAARAGLPTLQSHGRADPLLPFAAAERLRDLLRAGGLAVEWHPFDGGHELPRAVLVALADFLRRVAR